MPIVLVCLHIYEIKGQRFKAFLKHTECYYLRQGLSPNLELTCYVRLLGWQTPTTSCLTSLTVRL